jgi:hypothetical protein
MDAFIEYAGDFRSAAHGIGVSSATVDHFVGMGYSFRFEAVRR